jgi:hypothetical protein
MEYIWLWLKVEGVDSVAFVSSARTSVPKSLCLLDAPALHQGVISRTKWCACRNTTME